MNRRAWTFAILVSICSVGTVAQAQVFTGDPLVDQWAWGTPIQFAGNAAAPTSLNPANYGSDVTRCNSSAAPSWEDHCPSDLTYTPTASTGGTQAFGLWFASQPDRYEWTLVPVLLTDWDWECNCLVYYWSYEWAYAFSPAYSAGRVAAHIKFGNTQVSISGISGARYLSTLALKTAATVPNNTSQYNCDPSVAYGFGVAKLCNPLKSDVFLVPQGGVTPQTAGVGYEDKIIVPNPLCPSTRVRTGNSQDWSHGCFAFDGLHFYTNIPGAYQDTTKFDIGPPYIAGVGTVTPHLLTEGTSYWWTIDFKSGGTQSLLGETARHTANITMYDTAYPCVPNSGPLCQFNVDQTNIAPPSTVTLVP